MFLGLQYQKHCQSQPQHLPSHFPVCRCTLSRLCVPPHLAMFPSQLTAGIPAGPQQRCGQGTMLL